MEWRALRRVIGIFSADALMALVIADHSVQARPQASDAPARFTFRLDGPRGPERVRKEDSMHLCPAGAARIARAVLDVATPAWMLPAPAASWRAGDWALDRRFSDQPGACPE
jgi:hypothetical protein